jgi:hypothetical protein
LYLSTPALDAGRVIERDAAKVLAVARLAPRRVNRRNQFRIGWVAEQSVALAPGNGSIEDRLDPRPDPPPGLGNAKLIRRAHDHSDVLDRDGIEREAPDDRIGVFRERAEPNLPGVFVPPRWRVRFEIGLGRLRAS